MSVISEWRLAARPLACLRLTRLLALLGQVVAVFRRIPERLRNPRFWQVQALVAIPTIFHYTIETIGYGSADSALHDLAISLYIIPMLYASLSFGWEGAFMTAIWCGALTSPSMWFWHHDELHWLTELAQLLITMCIGMIVAWRVDIESEQRQIAEHTSARLGLLNEVVEGLSHTLDVEESLPQVLKQLRDELGLTSAALYVRPATPEGQPLSIQEGAVRPAAGLVMAASRGLDDSPEQAQAGDQTVFLPLQTTSGQLGYLAVARPGPVLRSETVGLLTTVANEIGVAIENARLLRERQETMESYVRQVTQAQEDERLRIARELHDDTAQQLVRVVRKLEQLAGRAEPALALEAEEDVGIVREILRSVRRFSRDLRPSILDDLGLRAALEMIATDANEQLPGGASLDVEGEPRRLEPNVELALFRIAQEALTNVHKHAEARSASVKLAFAEDEVTLSVSDDGRGFTTPGTTTDLARLGKLGIMGMKERAELAGGTFELESAPGKGTRIVVHVRQAIAKAR